MMKERLDGLVQHYSKDGPVILLESQSADHPASQYSYLAARPKAVITARGNRIQIQREGSTERFKANPWSALTDFRDQCGDWLFGYLGYDLKNGIEVLHSENADAVNAPDLFFMQPEVLIKIDERSQSKKVIKGAIPARSSFKKPATDIALTGLHSTVSKQQYCERIIKAKQEIFEGSYYEINLSHSLQAQFNGAPYQLYRKMRKAGPVPFGAYLQLDDLAVCSLSPERFLLKKGKMIYSQPIKGTMKRDKEAEKDLQLINRLQTSEKNRAENMMIVDLVRNDLSRVARPGSVKVRDLFEIQTFGTVHQMVSTVCGKTAMDNPFSIIKACYPMGSMTGAPKVSAMQAIETFENYRRGIYSGAIGYISPNGNFDFNVVIRTALIRNKLLQYPVGGAVTADSDPVEEWEETWLKAEALVKAVNDVVYC